MSQEVQRLRGESNTAILNLVTEFNTHATSVANINAQIIEFTNSSLDATELQDQRDIHLSKLAEFVDLQYFNAGDGSLNVFASGGYTIVSGGSAQNLTFQAPSVVDARSEYTPPTATSYIGPGNSGHPVGSIPGIFVGEVLPSTDITPRISSGRLHGLITVRDQDLPTIQAQLDELAEKLKLEINSAHNKGVGGPAPFGLAGDRYVSTDMRLDASGHVRIGIINDSGVLQEDKIFDLSKPEGFATYESSIFASAGSDVITTGGNLTFSDDGGTFSATVAYDNNDSLSDLATKITSNGTLNTQGISASVVTTDGTGLNRLKITDAGGQTFNIADSGSLVSDIAPRVRTIGDLATGISTMSNLSASINTAGRFQFVTSNNFRVAINELTSSLNAAGDISKGFSDYFGLNRLIDSTENFSIYRRDIFSSSTSDVITTAGKLQFSGNDGSAWQVNIEYDNDDSITDLVTKITSNATLSSEGITAKVVVDGATLDKFRIELSDTSSDEFSIVEVAGGSFLNDTNLRTDTRGLSNRMTIREDIRENNSFISRGTLQSNTFQSTALDSKTANFASTSPGVSAGALTFHLDASTSVTKSYTTANDLEDVVSAINTDTTLIGANIRAEVIVDGSRFKLKINDSNGDDFMVVDTGGLSVDVSQGTSLGDNSVAEKLGGLFTKAVSFNQVPAKGASGGFPSTETTLGDYSSKILAGTSAQAATLNQELIFQENLQEELASKNASISGVNMDEELSNLIIFEQAYVAAARLITTTQEMFKVLTEMI